MSIEQTVKRIVDQALNLNGQSKDWTDDTPLLGAIPELDSMAVMSVLTAFEELLGFTIEDDEISADVFTSFGSLIEFVRGKLG